MSEFNLGVLAGTAGTLFGIAFAVAMFALYFKGYKDGRGA